jgi:hypothetical protein
MIFNAWTEKANLFLFLFLIRCSFPTKRTKCGKQQHQQERLRIWKKNETNSKNMLRRFAWSLMTRAARPSASFLSTKPYVSGFVQKAVRPNPVNFSGIVLYASTRPLASELGRELQLLKELGKTPPTSQLAAMFDEYSRHATAPAVLSVFGDLERLSIPVSSDVYQVVLHMLAGEGFNDALLMLLSKCRNQFGDVLPVSLYADVWRSLVRAGRVSDARSLALATAKALAPMEAAPDSYAALVRQLAVDGHAEAAADAVAEYTAAALPMSADLRMAAVLALATAGRWSEVAAAVQTVFVVPAQPPAELFPSLAAIAVRHGAAGLAGDTIATLEKRLSAQSTAMATALCGAYAVLGRLADADRLLDVVLAAGAESSHDVLVAVADAHARRSNAARCDAILKQATAAGVPLSARLLATVAQAHIGAGNGDTATRLLHAAQRVSVIRSARFVRRVRDLCNMSEPAAATDLARRLSNDGVAFVPSVWASLAQAWARARSAGEAEVAVREMLSAGQRPTAAVLQQVVATLRAHGLADRATALEADVADAGGVARPF